LVVLHYLPPICLIDVVLQLATIEDLLDSPGILEVLSELLIDGQWIKDFLVLQAQKGDQTQSDIDHAVWLLFLDVNM